MAFVTGMPLLRAGAAPAVRGLGGRCAARASATAVRAPVRMGLRLPGGGGGFPGFGNLFGSGGGGGLGGGMGASGGGGGGLGGGGSGGGRKGKGPAGGASGGGSALSLWAGGEGGWGWGWGGEAFLAGHCAVCAVSVSLRVCGLGAGGGGDRTGGPKSCRACGRGAGGVGGVGQGRGGDSLGRCLLTPLPCRLRSWVSEVWTGVTTALRLLVVATVGTGRLWPPPGCEAHLEVWQATGREGLVDRATLLVGCQPVQLD